MTTGGHPPPISAEVLFNVRRRGLKRGDDYEYNGKCRDFIHIGGSCDGDFCPYFQSFCKKRESLIH